MCAYARTGRLDLIETAWCDRRPSFLFWYVFEGQVLDKVQGLRIAQGLAVCMGLAGASRGFAGVAQGLSMGMRWGWQGLRRGCAGV